MRRGYVETSGGDPVVSRMADYFAVLDMTAKLAGEALGLPWGELSPVEPLYDDLVAQASGADKAREAMTMVAGWASANAHKFVGRERVDGQGESIPPNDGWAGRWSAEVDWQDVAFYPDRLRELLRRWELDPESTLMAWRTPGLARYRRREPPHQEEGQYRGRKSVDGGASTSRPGAGGARRCLARRREPQWEPWEPCGNRCGNRIHPIAIGNTAMVPRVPTHLPFSQRN